MNRIRELRKEKKLTQTDLAKCLNTTTSNVSGWECGKWQPDNDTLIRLAEILDVSVDYLLGREARKKATKRQFFSYFGAKTAHFYAFCKLCPQLPNIKTP